MSAVRPETRRGRALRLAVQFIALSLLWAAGPAAVILAQLWGAR